MGVGVFADSLVVDGIEVEFGQHFSFGDFVVGDHEFFQFFAEHHLHLPVLTARSLQLLE